MYNEVGKELKNWARFFVVSVTVVAFIVGLFLGKKIADDIWPLTISIASIVSIIGYFIARLNAILLYAFGELVDCVQELNGKVESMKRTIQHKSADQSATPTTPAQPQSAYNPHSNQVPAPKPPMPEKIDGWLCMRCGTKNKPDAKYCYKCGGSEKQ